MDTCSRSDDQFINQEIHEAPHPRKALPYLSLLIDLHFLAMNYEGSAFWLDMRHQISTLQRELKVQQMVFVFLENLIFSNDGIMSQALNNIQTTAKTKVEAIEKAARHLIPFQGPRAQFYILPWNRSVSEFLETTDKKIKPDLKEFYLGKVDQLLPGNSFKEYDIFEFIDIIFLQLKDLEISRPDMIFPFKKKMEALEEMLQFVHIIFGKKTNVDVNLQNFLLYFRPWVNIVAALVILYWLDENDEKPYILVSSSLQKFNLNSLELARAYILVIKAFKPSNVSEILLMRETVERFTNMVLENLNVSTGDRFEMLREWLTLWIALLMDPPQANAEDEKLICAQTNLLVEKAESLIHSVCLDELGEDIAERRNILLNDFLEKMNKAKAEVIQLHVEISGLSWNEVPQTNGKGFFYFLLGNLQKKLENEMNLFPFEKHLITIVHKELSLLRPFLTDIFELQDEHKELREIWVQASNMAYLVDHVTDSCLSFVDVPIWSNLIRLSNAIEKIQFVKTEVSMFRKNDQMYKNRVISAKLNSKIILPRQEQANEIAKDDVKVGFADEEQIIIDRLTAGIVGLDIVAIVGMPGQGKTTLAQRVFQDSRVKLRFHKYGWCCISQAYDTKRILLDILKNVGEPVSLEQVPFLSQEDLADQLRKRLKGQRYLVVLDDIWDAKAWYELHLSFPDDNNGSRILLTSRNRNVPLEVNPHCCIVKLYPLSFKESWKLLRIKVFEKDWCPPALSDIGKWIAENCNGLPLAIVVVAGLLKKDKNVDSWKRISEGLKSQLKSEGCMSILDLSYNHLPDYLKPCFLYLGAFREDQIIDAKRLIQFWIVEGFIQNDGMKSQEAVANDYLMDLVSRSLVFVAQRSSRYGIKKCRVHGLLHELCLIKAEEERFLLVPNVSDHSCRTRNVHYRLSVHGRWESFADSEPVPSVRSLLVSGHGFRCPSSAPSFWKRFKLLKVLDLSHVIVKEADFYEITQLIHLRLLSVFCQSKIPSSIVNLFRLEVLRLYFGLRGIFPIAVMKMASIKHIVASSSLIEYTDDFDEAKLKLCPPLTNLETFNSLFSDDESFFKIVAEKLPNILKLGLVLYFCVRLSSYFKKLESLKLYIHPRPQEAFSPSTFDFPLTLKKLNLMAESPLSGAMISSIGILCNLEVLKLHANFEDKRWDVEDDEFLKLKFLEFKSSSIEEWNASDESFPCLEQLVVKNCTRLSELSCRFGAIFTLKRIEVHNCDNIDRSSFQQIVDDQMELGNEGLQFSIS